MVDLRKKPGDADSVDLGLGPHLQDSQRPLGNSNIQPGLNSGGKGLILGLGNMGTIAGVSWGWLPG